MSENEPKPYIDDLLLKSPGHNVFPVHDVNNRGLLIKLVQRILTK